MALPPPRHVGYQVPRSSRYLIRIVFATVIMTLAILAILPFTQALTGDPRDKTIRSVDVANIPPPEPPPPEPPPPEEEEQQETPELEEPPPMLDISMLESMLNPGTGGALAAGLDLSGFKMQESVQEAIIYSLRDLDRAPRALSTPIRWPPEVMRSGVRGTVRVTIRINEKGLVSVTNVADSPSPLVTEAVRQQVPEWRYESPTKDGEPVTAEYVQPITIDFSK
jgi:TonB family protein